MIDKNSFCTHYLYLVSSGNKFYYGIHSWNGEGRDESYRTSSRRVQQHDLLTWSWDLLLVLTSTDRSGWYRARREIYVEEQVRIKSKFGFPGSMNGWFDADAIPVEVKIRPLKEKPKVLHWEDVVPLGTTGRKKKVDELLHSIDEITISLDR